MKQKHTILAILFVMVFSAAAQSYERSLQKRTDQSIVGTWKGKFHDIPAVEVVLKADGAKLAGIAVFYVVDQTKPAEVKGKEESPIIDPVFDGNALSFKVKRNDGSILGAKMKFVGDNEALLKVPDDPNASDEQTINMTREK